MEKETIELVKKMIEDGNLSQEIAEKYCPELKGSEKEQSKKWILEYLYDGLRKSDEQFKGQFKAAIAWLEKQGVQKSFARYKVGDTIYYDSFGRLVSLVIANIVEDGTNNPMYEDKNGNSVFQNDIVEQMPVYKQGEERFKVGEWIITPNNQIKQIKSISFGNYHFTDGGLYNIIDVDNKGHLWTIQDAKDGDVLVCESGWTCIFKTLVNDETFSSYCFMDKTKWFCETGSECHTLNKEFMKAYNGEIKPATKEQRNALMKAMADAGYTFDFEKKELKKKIEQNSAEWSEADESYYDSALWHIKNSSGKEGIVYNWLKSLKNRVQPKQEWCEEDENIRQSIIDILTRQGFQTQVDWLKSLRPQK